MGSLKRRSLSGLERLPEDVQDAGGTKPYPPVGQVSVADGPAPGVAEGSVPQYDFPTSSPDALATRMTTDPGVPSEEIGTQVGQAGTGPIVTLPVATQRGTEPLSVATPSTRLSHTGMMRQSVVIHAKPRKQPPAIVPISQRKRRILVYATVITMLVVILSGVLASTVAAKDGSGGGINSLVSPLVQIFSARNGDAANIASQSLTPTPTPTPEIATTSADDASLSPASSSATTTSSGTSGAADDFNINRFTFGYCTYWANVRYHDLTGHGVPWLGNAYEWYSGALNYGWTVSSTPHVPSIMVLQPYVYDSGALGHVAVVESINSDGSVVTSNMNWTAGWDVEQTVVFQPGAGVSFVWYPTS